VYYSYESKLSKAVIENGWKKDVGKKYFFSALYLFKYISISAACSCILILGITRHSAYVIVVLHIRSMTYWPAKKSDTRRGEKPQGRNTNFQEYQEYGLQSRMSQCHMHFITNRKPHLLGSPISLLYI